MGEPISTAPSGFFCNRVFSNFIDQQHIRVFHAGRHYYTLSFCSFPWSVSIENSRNFLRPAALSLPGYFEKLWIKFRLTEINAPPENLIIFFSLALSSLLSYCNYKRCTRQILLPYSGEYRLERTLSS